MSKGKGSLAAPLRTPTKGSKKSIAPLVVFDYVPNVTADRVEATRDTRIVYVACPFCKQTHIHGWPYGETSIGYRSADCFPVGGGVYRILAPSQEGLNNL